MFNSEFNLGQPAPFLRIPSLEGLPNSPLSLTKQMSFGSRTFSVLSGNASPFAFPAVDAVSPKGLMRGVENFANGFSSASENANAFDDGFNMANWKPMGDVVDPAPTLPAAPTVQALFLSTFPQQIVKESSLGLQNGVQTMVFSENPVEPLFSEQVSKELAALAAESNSSMQTDDLPSVPSIPSPKNQAPLQALIPSEITPVAGLVMPSAPSSIEIEEEAPKQQIMTRSQLKNLTQEERQAYTSRSIKPLFKVPADRQTGKTKMKREKTQEKPRVKNVKEKAVDEDRSHQSKLARNRASAQRSRQRQSDHLANLEATVKRLNEENQQLQKKFEQEKIENTRLKAQINQTVKFMNAKLGLNS